MPPLKDIVRDARLARAMTLAEFAGAVGMSEGVVASLEYGGRLSQPILEKLAAFLQKPVSELDPDGYAVRRRSRRSTPVIDSPRPRSLDRESLPDDPARLG